jgi:hypothetical protein
MTQTGVRSSSGARCDTTGSWTANILTLYAQSQTGPRLVACRPEPGSRAEAKGGGAPTGVSATAAVAGKPYTRRPAYRGCVPMPSRWRAEIPTGRTIASILVLIRRDSDASGTDTPLDGVLAACQPIATWGRRCADWYFSETSLENLRCAYSYVLPPGRPGQLAWQVPMCRPERARTLCAHHDEGERQRHPGGIAEHDEAGSGDYGVGPAAASNSGIAPTRRLARRCECGCACR